MIALKVTGALVKQDLYKTPLFYAISQASKEAKNV